MHVAWMESCKIIHFSKSLELRSLPSPPQAKKFCYSYSSWQFCDIETISKLFSLFLTFRNFPSKILNVILIVVAGKILKAAFFSGLCTSSVKLRKVTSVYVILWEKCSKDHSCYSSRAVGQTALDMDLMMQGKWRAACLMSFTSPSYLSIFKDFAGKVFMPYHR